MEKSQASGMQATTTEHDDNQLNLENKVSKESVSLDLLGAGYIQSYIDFFHITHGSIPQIIAQNEFYHGDSALFEEIADEHRLLFMKEQLISAEHLKNEDRIEESLQCYTKIAEYFDSDQAYNIAAYFYNRCLEISRNSLYPEGEALANMGLGICNSKARNIEEAMRHHEMALIQANQHDIKNLSSAINKELIFVYERMAENFEHQEHYDGAIDFYEKCIKACNEVGDLVMEGKACHKIGQLYSRKDNTKKALTFHNKHYDIATQSKDRNGQIQALSALATAYRKMNQATMALEYLDKLYTIAKEATDSENQAVATLQSGMLNYQEGFADRAVQYFENHYDLVRVIGDRALIEQASVNLGMAKSKQRLDPYLNLVGKNLQDLLKWKESRNLKS
eukprot:CAMPEP_0115034454 /NCGR_PEP_ID=MMETSP0216-20121206/40661_1 /TAXON_ID=223996 /ORGANISM="Protocruzia adherens, Strain Boccale" /LENGTH=392 /DNA_ID=CAMNT_0002413343 /DNA_START=269 /DNA_END=1447 /DNA_ORIENTATION=+